MVRSLSLPHAAVANADWCITVYGLFQTWGSRGVGQGWRGKVGGIDLMYAEDHDRVRRDSVLGYSNK